MPDNGTFKNSTSTIRYNDSNTLNVMVPLISFNCLFDTNVGLIKLINKEFKDTRVFDKNTLDCLNTNFKVMQFVFNSRSDNILLDIMVDKDKELADELYSQFIEEEYANILLNSVYTDVISLLESMIKQPDIKVSIFCLRQEEIDFINKYLEVEVQAVLLDELLEHINIYKQFYFKSFINDPYCNAIYKYISKRAVFILDYHKNFDESGELLSNDTRKEMESQGIHFSIMNTFCYQF